MGLVRAIGEEAEHEEAAEDDQDDSLDPYLRDQKLSSAYDSFQRVSLYRLRCPAMIT